MTITEERAQGQLQLPQNACYSCHGCGDCCTRYAVRVDQTTHDRLAGVDWTQYSERFKEREAFIPLNGKGNGIYSHELARNGVRCIFLQDDNRCLIHAVLGGDAKPLMCRKFPYQFVSTPVGVNVSLDHACRCALAQKGDPIANRLSEMLALLNEVSEVAVLPAQIPLFMDFALDWRDYVELEKSLLALLRREGATIEARLIAGTSLILRVCQAQLRAKTAQTTAPPVAETLNELNADEMIAQATKTPASPLVHRLYVGVTVAAFESVSAEIRKEKFPGMVTRLRLIRGSGRVKLWALGGRKASLNALKQTRFDTTLSDLSELLERWLLYKLESRTLVPTTTLVRGWHHFMAHFVWARWFARAVASLRDSHVVEYDDLFEGILLTEMAARTLTPKPNVRTYGAFLDLMYDSPKFIPAAVADTS